MKKFIFLLSFVLSLNAFAILPNVVKKQIWSNQKKSSQLSYAILKAGQYCDQHHLGCYIVLVNSIGNPALVLATGYIPLQNYKKAIALGYTAQVLHFNTSGLSNAIKTHPIAKDLNQVYSNGVPLVFEPGGYFIPFKSYGYGVGITINDGKTGLEKTRELKSVDTVFNNGLKDALSFKKPITVKVMTNELSKATLKNDYFQYFLAGQESLPKCIKLKFACAVAVSNKYGAITSLVSSSRMIPAYVVMALNRAILSGTTGSNNNQEGYFSYTPGQPLLMKGELIGGVGATFINLSTQPTEWQNYGQQIETQFIQDFKALRKKYH